MNVLRKQPKVDIVVAGMAGISAAKRLVDAGFKNVIILEAADRIGGRIYTVPFGDCNFLVELGANWIHGPTAQNSIFRLAESIGVLQPYRVLNRESTRFMTEDEKEIKTDIVKDAELEQITWEKHREEYNIPEGGDVLIPGGYDQILNHLMKTIPRRSLMLRKQVVKIAWSYEENESIKIMIKDDLTLEADHVIVTSSIGYLKKHHQTLFTSKLPQSKIDVLNSLQLGRVNKIFLEFDRPIFEPTNDGIAFAWDDTSTGNVQTLWLR